MDAPAVLAHVEAWIDSQRARFTGPGLQFGLTDRERTLGVLTVGEASRGVPLGPEHLFAIASVSKSFTATLVMQEVEAGRIDLHAPVRTYLPWFAPPSPFGPITVHHLLTHTSGLAIGQEATGEATNELLQLAGQEPGFAPGERLWYSNAGYKALGLIVEATSGRPWFELARERILAPLGMHATEPTITFALGARLVPGHASPYGDRPWHSSYGLVPVPPYESGTADGTVCSSATEMCAFLRMLLGEDDGVLGAESLARMMAPHVHDPDDDVDYGYGLWSREVGGTRQVGHSGSFLGYTAYLAFEPGSGLGAVVLTNGASEGALRRDLLAFALAAARASQAGIDLPPIPEPRTLATIDGAEAYVGAFGAVRVGRSGDGLVAEVDGASAPLEVAGADAFACPLPALARFPLRFEPEGGEVVALAHGSEWYPRGGVSASEAPAPNPSWRPFLGHYRGFGLSQVDLRVLVRRGQLRLTDGEAGSDDELVGLADGSFRVGNDPWRPDRIRFDTEIDGCATRAVMNGAPLYRTFTA